eukprot:m.1088010 g.1088010  ORF g.1088010 m.1088010 type:complete len:300 (+) comp24286_c0_seq2:199-1098(+)
MSSCKSRQDDGAALKKLRLENEQLQKRVADLQQKLESLRKAKSGGTRVVKGSTVHVSIPRISKSDTYVDTDHNTCHHRIAQEQATACALASQLSSVSSERDHLKQVEVLLSTKCARLTRTIDVTRGECEQLQTQLATLQPQVQALIGERDGLDADCGCLREELAEMNTILSTHRENARKAQDKANCTIAELQAALSAEVDRARRLVADATASQARCNVAEERCAGLERDVAAGLHEQQRLRKMVAAGGALAVLSRQNEKVFQQSQQENEAAQQRLRAKLEHVQQQLQRVRLKGVVGSRQ